MSKKYKLLAADGSTILSDIPGKLGGYRPWLVGPPKK